MRKFIVLPLLVLLAACTERTAVGPDGDPGFVAAKGGTKGPPDKDKPPEPPPPANPAIAFNTYSPETGYCLRVMNDDGSNDARLICGSGVLSPSWSPEGGSLAFVKRWNNIEFPGEPELLRMDVTVDDDGVPVWSNQKVLATCAGDPAWSPVRVPALESKVVVAYPEAGYSENCHSNLLRYVTTNEVTNTNGTLYEADPGVRVSFPAWSPDAKKIAFVEVKKLPSGQNVWRINIISDLTAQMAIKVLDGPENLFTEIWDLDWSRGGDCLAFSAASAKKRRSKRHVYTLGLEAQPNSCNPGLTQIIEGGSGVAWSPDDKSLVVRSGGDLVKVNLENSSTETLRPGGFEQDWRRNPPLAPAQ